MIKHELRDIIKGDADELLALWRETWTATYSASLGSEAVADMLDELDRKKLSGMLPGKGERGICIASEGVLVGSAIIAERGGRAISGGFM